MAGKFVVKTASNGETYFRLQAGNGETILKSEMYKSKKASLNGIESVAPDDARYDRKATAGGQFMLNLKAGNHQVIGTRETYKVGTCRDGGIASVKTNAPTAKMEDLNW